MKKSLILFLFFLFTSCSSLFLNSTLKKNGVFDTKSKLKFIVNKKDKKNILFLGMHHIGRKEFYDDVAKKVDSLQKLGFTVFYEGVYDKKEIDSTITIRSAMKLRKLMGYSPHKYIDTATNIIGKNFKYRGKYKLINQPRYRLLGVDSVQAVRADIGLTELITAFEKGHKVIKLNSCDHKFKLRDKKYNCKKLNKKLLRTFENYYVKDFREKLLAKRILKSKKNKILVIYGKAHFFGLYFSLKSLDKNYNTHINQLLNN